MRRGAKLQKSRMGILLFATGLFVVYCLGPLRYLAGSPMSIMSRSGDVAFWISCCSPRVKFIGGWIGCGSILRACDYIGILCVRLCSWIAINLEPWGCSSEVDTDIDFGIPARMTP